MYATLTVTKTDYDMSGISFADATFGYDGNEHMLEITGTLPVGVTVSYSPNALTDVGSLPVTATFIGDDNHNPIAPMSATLKVVKDGKYHDVDFVTPNGVERRVVAHGESVANIPEVPHKDGYTAEWNADLTHIVADTTVEPRYTPIVYTVSYECEYGENDPENPAEYTVTSPTFTLKDAKPNVGYAFGGWYTTEYFRAGTEIARIETGSTGNVTVYAKFISSKYTVTYFHAGEQIKSETVDYGSRYTVSAYAPHADYEIMRWTDENGDVYTPSETIDFIFAHNLILTGEAAYAGSDFECSISGENATITQYFGNATSLDIPEYIKQENAYYRVTAIGENAFLYRDKLTGVTMPNSVTAIDDCAFDGCNALAGITIPDSVTSIGNYAFRGTAMTGITISHNVISIGNGAFAYCSKVIDITVDGDNEHYHAAENCLIETTSKTIVTGCKTSTVPTDGSVTRIGEYAFSDCAELKSIDIPSHITAIGDYSFSGCDGLTNITIPSTVTTVGEYAFAYCHGLTEITLSHGTTTIGDYAFAECDKLARAAIPDSVTVLGDFAFFRCEKLAAVTLGKGVTGIGIGTFDGCTVLADMIIPDNITFIGEQAFNGCHGLKSITVPDSVVSMERRVFRDCINLASVTIGRGMKTIPDGTFRYCANLKNVVLSDNVTNIEYYAFDGCERLASITIPKSVTTIDVEAFEHCYSLKTVYYKGTAAEWSKINITADHTLAAATVYYYSETNPYLTNPNDANKYWYCNGNEIAVWKKESQA